MIYTFSSALTFFEFSFVFSPIGPSHFSIIGKNTIKELPFVYGAALKCPFSISMWVVVLEFSLIEITVTALQGSFSTISPLWLTTPLYTLPSGKRNVPCPFNGCIQLTHIPSYILPSGKVILPSVLSATTPSYL